MKIEWYNEGLYLTGENAEELKAMDNLYRLIEPLLVDFINKIEVTDGIYRIKNSSITNSKNT